MSIHQLYKFQQPKAFSASTRARNHVSLKNILLSSNTKPMGSSCFEAIIRVAKHTFRHDYSSLASAAAGRVDIPRGYLAVYVGESMQKSRFVVPISYLNHPSFNDLLKSSEEEYGFDHPMGGLTIPCSESVFISVTSSLE